MPHSITRPFASAAALTAVLAVAVPASAGTLQVRDNSDLLSAEEETALRQEAARWPFDARVLTDSRFTTRESFDRYVASQLTSPQMVIVGVDPTHRWSSVHFGTSTRVATNRFTAIENAGDPFFRTGQWRGGVSAILSAAGSSVGTAPAEGTSTEAPGFPWKMVLFGVVAIAGVALAVRFFQRRNATNAGAGYYNQPTAAAGTPWGPQAGYGPQPGYNPQYGPGYGPGYGPTPGSSIGTGIAGAALGGLAGYALGNAMSNRGEGAENQAGTVGGGDPGAGAWDAGGSSSGWDDGGGGGGGGDFGGGDGGGGDW